MAERSQISLYLFIAAWISIACSSNQVSNQASQQPAAETRPVEAARLTEADIEHRDEIESKMMRGEYLHDGSSILYAVGDIDSVPALLVVLKTNPPHQNGTMVCTTAHAIEALERLTGAKAGITYEAWAAWWETYKQNHPVSGRLEK